MTLFGIISILNGIEFKLMIGEEGEVTEVLDSYTTHQHDIQASVQRGIQCMDDISYQDIKAIWMCLAEITF